MTAPATNKPGQRLPPIGARYYSPRYWPTWIGLFLLRCFSMLPLPLLWLLGAGVGELVCSLNRYRRNIATRNIERCFPELDGKQRARLVRRHFRAMGQALLSVGVHWWAGEGRLVKMIHYRGKEHYDRALEQGRNVILLAPHFLALEAGVWLSRERPMVYMYQKTKNPLFDTFMRRGRRRYKGELVERGEKLMGLIRKLRRGIPMVYLPDQNPGLKRGIFSRFFGIPAVTHPALSRFAGLADAVVIPCIVLQSPRGRGFEIVFKPPLDDYPSGDLSIDAERMNLAIEEAVREYPEQYVWVHKRFKIRPKGEPDFYQP